MARNSNDPKIELSIFEMANKIRANQKHVRYRKKITRIKKEINMVFSIKEINLLISSQQRYQHLFKKRKLDLKGLNILADALLVINSYYERMTQIKVGLLAIRKDINSIGLKMLSLVRSYDKFLSLKLQDRKELIEQVQIELRMTEEIFMSYWDITDNALNQLDKAAFNLKTLISVIKEKINGRKAQKDQYR